MAQHIKVLSVLFIIFGVLSLIAAVAIFILGAGTAATILHEDHSSDAQVGAAWAGGCMTFVAVLVGVLSIPSIITGLGLARRQSWARILTIILSVLSLPSFPIGTALGVYGLVIMLNEETKTILVQ